MLYPKGARPIDTRGGTLCRRTYTARMRILATLVVLVGCVPDLSTVCPHPAITQGVFGEIVDSGNVLEENVKVDVYGILNGVKDAQIGTRMTDRGGYQFPLNPSQYILCAKNVCTTITVPTGLVEFSAVDATSGLTWDAAVAVPPEEMIGPCTYGK
jgi:hypothetical protein